MADSRPAKTRRIDPEAFSDDLFFASKTLPGLNSVSQTAPHFSQPALLTSFSYDGERTQHYDNSSLKYFKPPRQPAGLDLGRGYDQATWKPEVPDGLDGLLNCLERLGSEHDELLDSTRLVTWRGMVTKLATAAYETREPFYMTAMVIDGTLYIEEHRPEDKREDITDERRRPMYYGYAFESYCTTAAKPSELAKGASLPAGEVPGWGGNVNTNEQWCAVCRTNLGGMRMIIGGEVDCVIEHQNPQQPVAPNQFVELKTNMTISSEKDEFRFEKFKMIKFYMQSYLLGVPRVFVGFRSREGQLAAIQELKTLDMPRMIRGKPHAWSPSVALNTASSLLYFIYESISGAESTRTAERCLRERQERKEVPRQWPVFRISFEPGRRQASLQVQELPQQADSEGRVGILTRSYVENVLERMERRPKKGQD